jgi:hypothetical protein
VVNLLLNCKFPFVSRIAITDITMWRYKIRIVYFLRSSHHVLIIPYFFTTQVIRRTRLGHCYQSLEIRQFSALLRCVCLSCSIDYITLCLVFRFHRFTPLFVLCSCSIDYITLCLVFLFHRLTPHCVLCTCSIDYTTLCLVFVFHRLTSHCVLCSCSID